MFNILHDSIFNPKALVKQVNRSGWFIFLYVIIMAVFMTLGPAVSYIRYDNSNFDYENTGCQLQENLVVCDGENYDPEALYYISDIKVYLLDVDMEFTSMAVPNQAAILVQGDSISLYFGLMQISSAPIFGTDFEFTTIEEGIAMFSNVILLANIVASFINNLIVIILITLISTLMFMRYRKEIRYSKLFKLTAMAITPVALLITFYNIVVFDDWLFFALGFFAYIPMFRLNRELFYQSMMRKYQDEHGEVVESINNDELDHDEDEDSDNDQTQ